MGLVVVGEPVHGFVAAAIGDRDDLCVADFGQGEGIDLAFDNVDIGRVFDGIHVVGYLFAASFCLSEHLVAGAELGGHDFAVLDVVEVDSGAVAAVGHSAVFLFVGGHPVGAAGDVHEF